MSTNLLPKRRDVIVHRLRNADGYLVEAYIWFKLDRSRPRLIDPLWYPFNCAILSINGKRSRFGDDAYNLLRPLGLDEAELMKRFHSGQGIAAEELHRAV